MFDALTRTLARASARSAADTRPVSTGLTSPRAFRSDQIS